MSSREALNMKLPPIQSTAGAVPVRNEKGELSMEKVKVKRYVSGKRPDYAPMESSDEEEEDFQFVKKGKELEPEVELEEEEVSDPRLKRLLNRVSEDVEERLARHRQIAEPEVVVESSEDSDEGTWHPEREESSEEEEEEEEEEVDDEEIERRRAMMRQRAVERKNEEMEVMEVEEEGKSGAESESESEYEEYTDSEDEAEPRLKPVFIRKYELKQLQMFLKTNALKCSGNFLCRRHVGAAGFCEMLVQFAGFDQDTLRSPELLQWQQKNYIPVYDRFKESE